MFQNLSQLRMSSPHMPLQNQITPTKGRPIAPPKEFTQLHTKSLANFHAKPFMESKQPPVAKVPVMPKLTFVKAMGSCGNSPLKVITRKTVITTERMRSGSLDLARIVTKESTVLLQDIYKDIQSTLKKYDGMVKDHRDNKIKNDSVKDSMVKSMSGSSFKKSASSGTGFLYDDSKELRVQASNNGYQRAYDAQIETLKQQQSLLLLMLQNNTVQEQILQQHKPNKQEDQENAVFQQRHQRISTQITKLKTLKKQNSIQKFSQFVKRLSRDESNCPSPSPNKSHHLDLPRQMPHHLDLPRQMPPQRSDIHIFSQEECKMTAPQSGRQEVVVDFTQKLTIKNNDDKKQPLMKIFKSKPVIEIQLKKKRKSSHSVRTKGESSSILTSPHSTHTNLNKKRNMYFIAESDQGRVSDTDETSKRKSRYSLIHAAKKPKEFSCEVSEPMKQPTSSTGDFSARNQVWKSKIVDKIRCQQELKKTEEMKQCTFKPTIKKLQQPRSSTPRLQQSKILQTDTTNSELNRDLKEIVSILDEFQEFQQFIAVNLPNQKIV